VRGEQGAYAYEITDDHFDVGTPIGMLKASVYAALNREDMARELKHWLEPILKS
jgi:UTP-glucose-1-phosphate uridylyltransferase